MLLKLRQELNQARANELPLHWRDSEACAWQEDDRQSDKEASSLGMIRLNEQLRSDQID